MRQKLIHKNSIIAQPTIVVEPESDSGSVTEVQLVYPTDEQTVQIGQYLLDGLTEKEACIMVKYPYACFTDLLKHEPAFADFIEKKNIEFKHNQLKNIKASNDPKNSMWLLERTRPKEFSLTGKRDNDTPNNINIAQLIVQEIQGSSSKQPVRDQEKIVDAHFVEESIDDHLV